MSAGLCLDAGALIALERGDRRLLRLLEPARRRGLAVAVPVCVVAQVWRGGPRQTGLARFLRLPEVRYVDLDLPTARAVGELCPMTGAVDVIDSHVVLHALSVGLKGVTSDPDDFAPFAPDLEVIPV